MKGMESQRNAIVGAARRVLTEDPAASLESIASAAGVSRASFYRHFGSRAQLLAELEMEPDPGARDRILVAAAELIGRDGLAALSMDELAAAAGVSRASVYRIFPGKAALFDALVETFAPWRQVIARLEELGDQPAEVVIPELYRTGVDAVAANVGIIRSIFFEITSGSPDARQTVGGPIYQIVHTVGGYLERQMDAGRLRRMHPTLAAQILIGPLLFHLFTRPNAKELGGLDMSLDETAREMAEAVLRGFRSGG